MEKSVEIWRVRSEGEVRKSLARKRRRRREKEAKLGEEEILAIDHQEDNAEDLANVDLSELIVPYLVIRTQDKVCSIDWSHERPKKRLQMLVATNNQLGCYSFSSRQKDSPSNAAEPPEYEKIHAVDLPGHRTDVNF